MAGPYGSKARPGLAHGSGRVNMCYGRAEGQKVTGRAASLPPVPIPGAKMETNAVSMFLVLKNKVFRFVLAHFTVNMCYGRAVVCDNNANKKKPTCMLEISDVVVNICASIWTSHSPF